MLLLFEAFVLDAELFVTLGTSLVRSNDVLILSWHCESRLNYGAPLILLNVYYGYLLYPRRLN